MTIRITQLVMRRVSYMANGSERTRKLELPRGLALGRQNLSEEIRAY